MNLRSKLLRGLTAGGLALVLTTGVAFASIGTGTVTAGSSLRMRAQPNTSSATLATAPKSAKVDILETAAGGWYKVSYKNMVGYMSGDWLAVTLTGGGKDDSAAPPQGGGSQDSAAPAEAAETGHVNAGPLNVRSGPGTGYSRVGSLRAGAAVTVTAKLDGWYQVAGDGIDGYVSAQYITLDAASRSDTVSGSAAAAPADPEKGYVTVGALNVRSGPGTGYAKIGSLGYGAAVTVLSRADGWCQIDSGGLSGYVSEDYLSSTAPAPAAGGVGAQAAALARKQVGKRYVYGAVGPNSFDCSGLVYYVYHSLGYNIAHGASSQYYNFGQFVPKSLSSIQPGDLVFFFDKKNDSSGGRLPVTHVGIYIGDNQFVHASTPSKGVLIDPLFGDHYGNRLVAVKRVG